MWIYVQKTGNLFRQNNDGLRLVTTGYSGRGPAMNDPDSQCVKDFGPLPRGTYTFAAPTAFNFMTDCLRLTPSAANDMCKPARDGFWVHDGIFSGPHGDSSHGCICLKRPVRQMMWASQDHTLQVVALDPPAEAEAQGPVGQDPAAANVWADAGGAQVGTRADFAVAAPAMAADPAAAQAAFTLRQGRCY